MTSLCFLLYGAEEVFLEEEEEEEEEYCFDFFSTSTDPGDVLGLSDDDFDCFLFTDLDPVCLTLLSFSVPCCLDDCEEEEEEEEEEGGW